MESDRELSCVFPALPFDLLDDVINGTLQLTYSLVAASVPGLDNLHLISQFVIEFVNDPVITPYNGTISFDQVGSNAAITISVGICINYVCIYICSYVHIHSYCYDSL